MPFPAPLHTQRSITVKTPCAVLLAPQRCPVSPINSCSDQRESVFSSLFHYPLRPYPHSPRLRPCSCSVSRAFERARRGGSDADLERKQQQEVPKRTTTATAATSTAATAAAAAAAAADDNARARWRQEEARAYEQKARLLFLALSPRLPLSAAHFPPPEICPCRGSL